MNNNELGKLIHVSLSSTGKWGGKEAKNEVSSWLLPLLLLSPGQTIATCQRNISHTYILYLLQKQTIYAIKKLRKEREKMLLEKKLRGYPYAKTPLKINLNENEN